MWMVVNMNYNFIEQKRNERIEKIRKYCEENDLEFGCIEACIAVDQESPITTNRKMLEQAGFTLKEVNDSNWRDWAAALEDIGIRFVNLKEDKNYAHVINEILNEQITECWGGPDMQECIDLKDVK